MTEVTVEPFPVAALAALFDDGLPGPVAGDPLPPYWHLAACAVPTPSGILGPDGHPESGAVTAPPGLPRRMFAGGRLTIHGPVQIGEQLDRTLRVTASTDKPGRSGPLRFITVEAVYRQTAGNVVLVEEQDLVYRPASPPAGAPARTVSFPAAGPPAPAMAPGSPLRRLAEPLRAQFRADAVALHRFSAATSNAHRIHYDYPYATSIEGYPGLVVHGPLLLLSMLELIRLDLATVSVTRISFRAQAPVFAAQTVDLCGERESEGVIRLTARPTDVQNAAPTLTVKCVTRPPESS